MNKSLLVRLAKIETMLRITNNETNESLITEAAEKEENLYVRETT